MESKDNNVVLMCDTDSLVLCIGGEITGIGLDDFVFKPTSEFTCTEGKNLNVKVFKDEPMPCELIVDCKKHNTTDFKFTIVEKKDEDNWNRLFKALSHM